MARQKKREGEGVGTSPASSPEARQQPTRPSSLNRRKTSAKKEEHGEAPPAPANPIEEGDTTNIKLVHPRLLTKDLENQEALVRQRREYGPDLFRHIFNRGNQVESALGPADQGTGRHGKFDPSRLADELIGDINALIEFALENGRVPTRIRMLHERIEALEDIRSLLRVELRSILQAELRAALREELIPLLQSVPTAQPVESPAAEVEAEQGLLTDVAPGAQDMLDSLFPD